MLGRAEVGRRRAIIPKVIDVILLHLAGGGCGGASEEEKRRSDSAVSAHNNCTKQCNPQRKC